MTAAGTVGGRRSITEGGNPSTATMCEGPSHRTMAGPPDRVGSAGQSEKLTELTRHLSGLEDRLQSDFSMSEASKYALKKDIAKVRANIMRLKRNGEAT
jgi:hypothetical protein